MAVREVLTYPHPLLKQRAREAAPDEIAAALPRVPAA